MVLWYLPPWHCVIFRFTVLIKKWQGLNLPVHKASLFTSNTRECATDLQQQLFRQMLQSNMCLCSSEKNLPAAVGITTFVHREQRRT